MSLVNENFNKSTDNVPEISVHYDLVVGWYDGLSMMTYSRSSYSWR
jgi:hypothetical protein